MGSEALGAVLIVGLGNPEPKYEKTRHNLGFRAIEGLGEKLGCAFGLKFEGEIAQLDSGSTKAVLLKPLTFMNRSGNSVGPASRFFKIPPARIVVAHDELDLPLGRIQLKVGGGHGGHNGLRSIEAVLGSREFARLRMGIGRPPAGWDPADYVLGRFAKEEVDVVEEEVKQAVEALGSTLSDGILKAMNRYNRRS